MSSFPFYITPSEFDEQVAEHELLLKEDESSMRWSSRNVDEADRWIRKKWWFAIISAISFLFIGLGMILDLEMWINLEGLALATIVSLSVYATTEGVVRSPSEFSIIFGLPLSKTATQELVVPRSIPIIFDIF